MRKKNNFDDLLTMMIDFMNEGDHKKIPRSYERLCEFTSYCGFHYMPHSIYSDIDENGNVTAAGVERAKMEQISLLNAANYLVEGGGGLRQFESVDYFGVWEEDGQRKLRLFFYEGEANRNRLADIYIYLMFFLDMKGIRICPGCDKFFTVPGPRDKKVCSNKCRQRVYQEGLTVDQKRKQQKRRSELYHKKKRGER